MECCFLKLAMSGIDFKSAPLELRERISFGTEEIIRMTKSICRDENISGCAILSTCNRTELYISCGNYYSEPSELLLGQCGPDREALADAVITMYDEDAARHLSEVACGLHSAILCEEQIVTQINEAAEVSRTAGGMDAVLNTLFRSAVSAGKKALTEHTISAVPPSAAYRAADMAENILGTLQRRKVLVIGSGKMGCLAAEVFMSRGCDVKITMRSYRSGTNYIPRGAVPVEYSSRLVYIPECDVLISATRSPHFTVMKQDLEAMVSVPACIFDLAVPRDIQPEAAAVSCLFDIDDIYTDEAYNRAELNEIYAIAAEAAQDFEQWEKFRGMMPVMDEIKRLVGERVVNSAELAELKSDTGFEDIAYAAAEKAADLMLKSLKGSIEEKTLGICIERLKKGMHGA